MATDAHIITIGDEIMTGHTVDTNSSFIAKELTNIGIHVSSKSSVGDSVEDMEEAFRSAFRQSRIVITTGGLGPTDDDLTKRAIVKTFKRNLIFYEEVLDELRTRYQKRGLEMPALNQNQALLPQGATFFPNALGSAVGICIAEDGRFFIALPGVPFELKHLMTEQVIPFLKEKKLGSPLRISKFRTAGVFESRLAEMISAGLKLEPGVKLAYLPHLGGVDLRLMAEAITQEETERKIKVVEQFLRNRLGESIYATDDTSLETIIGNMLKGKNATLSVAESCTGGLLGKMITNAPGSSAYFSGGVISYSNQVKETWLDVRSDTLQKHGAVSAECAIEMADGCKRRFNTTYSLSITGVAGPDGGTLEKPVGLVYIAVASPQKTAATKFNFGTSERSVIRTRAVYTALDLLRRELLKAG